MGCSNAGKMKRRPAVHEWYPLVHKVVWTKFEWAWSWDKTVRTTKSPIDYHELVAAGNDGLMNAATWWNPAGGASFKTYAYKCICVEVKKYINHQMSRIEWSMVKFSELNNKINCPIADFIDPSQEEDLYNILHKEWVDECIARLKGSFTRRDFELLIDRSQGDDWKTIAKKHRSTIHKVSRRYKVLIEQAREIIEDQRKVLDG